MLRLVACESRTEGVYAWLRRGAEGNPALRHEHPGQAPQNSSPSIWNGLPRPGNCSTPRDSCWGGAFEGPRNLRTVDGGVYGRDYTLLCDLPAMGSRLFRLSPEAPHPGAAGITARHTSQPKG